MRRTTLKSVSAIAGPSRVVSFGKIYHVKRPRINERDKLTFLWTLNLQEVLCPAFTQHKVQPAKLY